MPHEVQQRRSDPTKCPGGSWPARAHRCTGPADSADSDLLLEGSTGEAASGDRTRIWAGRTADSFYIDLSLLAIINGAVKNGSPVDLSGWRPADAQNSFANSHVNSIVLEVSNEHPQLRPALGSACGAPRNWLPTRAAGGRSTGPGTR
jgi:hypothetical protein